VPEEIGVITRCEAIVLQTRPFRESSRIVTLFTREQGKLGVVARGVTRAKSPLGAVLQPMNHLTATVYVKEGRDLQNLSGAESLQRCFGITDSLERITTGLSIVELVNAVVPDGDRNDHLFTVLLGALRELNDPSSRERHVHLWFIVQLADALGYTIRTDGCGVCDEPMPYIVGDVHYSLAIGAPLCGEHRQGAAARTLSSEAFALLKALESSDVGKVSAVMCSEKGGGELLDALTAFIRYHVDGMHRLKVGEVTAKLLGDLPGVAG
jgi:DNA repair protein RecO (recombination protein O)